MNMTIENMTPPQTFNSFEDETVKVPKEQYYKLKDIFQFL